MNGPAQSRANCNDYVVDRVQLCEFNVDNNLLISFPEHGGQTYES
jgi:hypothetical protein